MKALTYHGPHHVKVENVPDPGIEQPDDIILRVTATAICGSDLHLYRGKIPQVKHGDIFGHEFMGEVVETGRDVKNIQKGDRVVIPFVIACGDCFFCRLQQYSACENTNDGHGAAMNKNRSRRRRHCLVIAICMAAFPADRPNMFACQKVMSVHLRCRRCYLTIRRCFFLIFCLPPGRRQKCPDSARFQRGGFWRRAGRITDYRLCATAGRRADLRR